MSLLDLKNNERTIHLLRDDNGVYFEVVYKYYFAPLYSFATQYLPHEKAEGIVQETMIWLWENRKTLIPEMSLKSLLFTIVRNKCLNQTNHQKIRNRIHEAIKEKYRKQFHNPDFYFENELSTLFIKAMEQLPENFRQAFEMSRIGKMTHKEIAKSLGVSPQTVNYRLSKALELLRKELKDYLPIFLAML
ncbi:MAG: RNA polymerase sigma-70 factor [Bacteroidia bacterium]|nr:RNA polymerase sigma-70 factor [Bacteroidia bacterium]